MCEGVQCLWIHARHPRCVAFPYLLGILAKLFEKLPVCYKRTWLSFECISIYICVYLYLYLCRGGGGKCVEG